MIKKSYNLLLLFILSMMMLVACGSDDKNSKTNVATADDADKAVVQDEENNGESMMIRAEFDKEELYTTEKHRTDPKYNMTFNYGEDAIFPCADLMYETGKEPHHLSSEEYLAIASKVSSEEEFIEEVLKLNIIPDIVTREGSKTYFLNSHWDKPGTFHYALCIADAPEQDMCYAILWENPLLINHKQWFPALHEGAIKNVKRIAGGEDVEFADAYREMYKQYLEVCEEQEFNITEYSYLKALSKGELEPYTAINIDALLSTKDECENRYEFIKKFNKRMPVPDVRFSTDEGKCEKELYLVNVNSMNDGVIIINNKHTYCEINLFYRVMKDIKFNESDGGIKTEAEYEYYKLTYDELTREKVDELLSKK